jgi:hypothetical protein
VIRPRPHGGWPGSITAIAYWLRNSRRSISCWSRINAGRWGRRPRRG